MDRDIKSGDGYCGLKLKRGDGPLVIYRIDENGRPVVNEREVILIALSKDSRLFFVKLALQGIAYQFLRGNVISEDYNESRCGGLSRENWEKLRGIVAEKRKKLEGRV